MQETFNRLSEFVLDRLPGLLVPVVIFLGGWLVAIVLAGVVRAALHRTRLDDRLAAAVLGEQKATEIDTERWGARIVYWLTLFLVAVAALESMRLTAATEPIKGMLADAFNFIPRLLGAAVVLFIAWLVAMGVRRVIQLAFTRWQLDRRIVDGAREAPAYGPLPPSSEQGTDAGEPAEGTTPLPVGRGVGEAGYWLVMLLFMPAVLDTLDLGGLLAPVQAMVGDVLAFLPRLFSAALIAGVGWYVARVVQRLVTHLLRGMNVDQISSRVGLGRMLGDRGLSSVVGLVAYALLLIPVAVAALQALQLEAITTPASRMLDSFFTAVPALFGAALVLIIAWIAGRLLQGFVQHLLEGSGFDRALARLGISSERLYDLSPSRAVGGAVLIAAMLFASIEATSLLGFEAAAGLASDVTVFAGRAVLALLVLGAGLYFARLAADAIERTGVGQGRVLAVAARVTILALASTMALRQLGIADEIIELGFGIVLGAAGVAAAIAFGLGGREAAAAVLNDLRARLARPERQPRAAE